MRTPRAITRVHILPRNVVVAATIVATIVATMAGLAGGCAQTQPPPPEEPTGAAPPFVSGTYDCTAAATWKTTSFAGLVPAVERAVINDNPQSTLTSLLGSHAVEEVTCVAGYVHDQSVDQQATVADKGLASRRVSATAAWIEQQSARGLVVTNYRGQAH